MTTSTETRQEEPTPLVCEEHPCAECGAPCSASSSFCSLSCGLLYAGLLGGR
jgi:hypothetical protein